MDEGPRTISDAARLIRAGELTPSALLEQCLARVDVYEPAVKAWAYLDRERARRDAERLTDELRRGHHRGPLHGIPVGVKDIIDVFDMPTGCGSGLWANSYARTDAVVVERLRQAGAVVLGKTVTTAYAYLDPPPTRNPWDLDRTPGGSSSGSAAAVACGMVLAALATQTGGSTIRPAGFCGVCALKPTYGRISRQGVLPLAPTLDHVGIMANCVRDLALVFEAAAGGDGVGALAKAVPAATWMIDRRLSPDGTERPPRFVRLRGVFADLVEPEMAAAMDRLAFDLRSLASTPPRVEEAVPPAGFADVVENHRTIMAVEAAAVHGGRLDARPDDYPPKIRDLIESGRRAGAVAFRHAQVHRDGLKAELSDPAVWGGEYLTPAATGPAPGRDTTGNPVLNSPWTYLGLPTVSFPIGWSADGLPLAAQLTGAAEADGFVLEAAAWVERAVGFERRLPPIA